MKKLILIIAIAFFSCKTETKSNSAESTILPANTLKNFTVWRRDSDGVASVHYDSIENIQDYLLWAYNKGYDTIGMYNQDFDYKIYREWSKFEKSRYDDDKLRGLLSYNVKKQLQISGLNVDNLKSLDGNLNLKPGDGISSGYNRTSDLRYTFYSAKLCSFLSKTTGKGYDNSDLIKIEKYLKKYYKSNDIQYWEINEYHSSYILYNNVDLWLLIDRLLNNLYED